MLQSLLVVMYKPKIYWYAWEILKYVHQICGYAIFLFNQRCPAGGYQQKYHSPLEGAIFR